MILSSAINSEAEVNADMNQLLWNIIIYLDLGHHVYGKLYVPVIDTAPDLTIIAKANKTMAGFIEGKKPPRTNTEENNMFGTDTQVAGEVFEQLFMMKMQNQSFAVGLIATKQSFQLVCTEDVGNEVLILDDAIAFFEARTNNEHSKGRCTSHSPEHLRKRPKKEKGKSTTPEKLAIKITDESVERTFFATERISFGAIEADNRKVIELLIAFVLLCVKSLQAGPSEEIQLPKKGDKCMSRLVNLKQGIFALKQIELSDAIAFGSQPTKKRLQKQKRKQRQRPKPMRNRTSGPAP